MKPRIAFLASSVLSRDSNAFEELDQAPWSIRGEAHFEPLRGLLGRRLTAGKHGSLVSRQCGLGIVAVLGAGIGALAAAAGTGAVPDPHG